MHIAVLIYGRLNHCVEQYENIKKAIGNHMVDFFVSSDNSPYMNDFIELYKPIDYNNKKIRHKTKLSKYPGKRYETNLHTMCLHFINKMRVFQLLEQYVDTMKIKFDIILSLRVDVVIDNQFTFYTEKNTIYIPRGYDYVIKAINDQIAYGSYDVMKQYNNIYKNMIYLLDNQLSIPHPESLTLANMKHYKIKRFNLKYRLLKNQLPL